MRAYRERKKQGMVTPATPIPTASVCDWIRDTLIVPPGHPRAGEPWNLMDWQGAVHRRRHRPEHRWRGRCALRGRMARTALVGALVCAYLVGPLRKPGWRAGILSISRPKAGELLQQIEDIAKASKLVGIEVRRTPVPGHILGPDGRGRGRERGPRRRACERLRPVGHRTNSACSPSVTGASWPGCGRRRRRRAGSS